MVLVFLDIAATSCASINPAGENCKIKLIEVPPGTVDSERSIEHRVGCHRLQPA